MKVFHSHCGRISLRHQVCVVQSWVICVYYKGQLRKVHQYITILRMRMTICEQLKSKNIFLVQFNINMIAPLYSLTLLPTITIHTGALLFCNARNISFLKGVIILSLSSNSANFHFYSCFFKPYSPQLLYHDQPLTITLIS